MNTLADRLEEIAEQVRKGQMTVAGAAELLARDQDLFPSDTSAGDPIDAEPKQLASTSNSTSLVQLATKFGWPPPSELVAHWKQALREIEQDVSQRGEAILSARREDLAINRSGQLVWNQLDQRTAPACDPQDQKSISSSPSVVDQLCELLRQDPRTWPEPIELTSAAGKSVESTKSMSFAAGASEVMSFLRTESSPDAVGTLTQREVRRRWGAILAISALSVASVSGAGWWIFSSGETASSRLSTGTGDSDVTPADISRAEGRSEQTHRTGIGPSRPFEQSGHNLAEMTDLPANDLLLSQSDSLLTTHEVVSLAEVNGAQPVQIVLPDLLVEGWEPKVSTTRDWGTDDALTVNEEFTAGAEPEMGAAPAPSPLEAADQTSLAAAEPADASDASDAAGPLMADAQPLDVLPFDFATAGGKRNWNGLPQPAPARLLTIQIQEAAVTADQEANVAQGVARGEEQPPLSYRWLIPVQESDDRSPRALVEVSLKDESAVRARVRMDVRWGRTMEVRWLSAFTLNPDLGWWSATRPEIEAQWDQVDRSRRELLALIEQLKTLTDRATESETRSGLRARRRALEDQLEVAEAWSKGLSELRVLLQRIENELAIKLEITD